jgi:hypothetical protein
MSPIRTLSTVLQSSTAKKINDPHRIIISTRFVVDTIVPRKIHVTGRFVSQSELRQQAIFDSHKNQRTSLQQHEPQALIAFDILCPLWMHGGAWKPFGKSLDDVVLYRLHLFEFCGGN